MVAQKLAEYRRLLQGVPLLANLDDASIDKIVGIARTQKCPGREVVVRKGDPAVNVFVTIKGRSKVTTTGPDGRDVTLSIMGAGEVFGEIALLDGEPRSATVTALEPCEFLVLDRAAFLDLLERTPAIAVRLLEICARRLRRLSERVEDAMFLDLGARLAKQLVDLSERYGKPTPEGEVRIALRLTQGELGELVGATRESVNKQLRAWGARGLLDFESGFVVVHRPEELREIATG